MPSADVVLSQILDRELLRSRTECLSLHLSTRHLQYMSESKLFFSLGVTRYTLLSFLVVGPTDWLSCLERVAPQNALMATDRMDLIVGGLSPFVAWYSLRWFLYFCWQPRECDPFLQLQWTAKFTTLTFHRLPRNESFSQFALVFTFRNTINREREVHNSACFRR